MAVDAQPLTAGDVGTPALDVAAAAAALDVAAAGAKSDMEVDVVSATAAATATSIASERDLPDAASDTAAEDEVEEEEEDEGCDGDAEQNSEMPHHSVASAAGGRAAYSSFLASPGQSSPGRYPYEASVHFGECYPHRLRWAHAVNSQRRLRDVLATRAHFLEADVAAGTLRVDVPPPQVAEASHHPSSSSSSGVGAPSVTWRDNHLTDTRVRAENGSAVIMAHYPTESSSDLSLEQFILDVIRHNEKVLARERRAASAAAKSAGDGRQPEQIRPLKRTLDEADAHRGGRPVVGSAFSGPLAEAEADNGERAAAEEAAAFAQKLNCELEDEHASATSAFAACVGTRSGPRRGQDCSAPSSLKGVKLDFKQFETVLPSLRFLRDLDAPRRLGGHLWLNADVFAGPGALLSPMDAREFVSLCAEVLPEAVLSLSWGTTVLSTTRHYTSEMVERMIALCMSPFVPRSLSAESRAKRAGSVTDGEILLTPAAVCQHITFAVAAEYALGSVSGLRHLLDTVPGTSLTVFSGVGSMSLPPGYVRELITTYGKTQLFLDLKLGKPWRGCGLNGTGAGCALM
eukprot:TRINITY_DN16972_c0_g2_i1.p1 TRINITY_DN16972_c0_g2~~TRINITY_DN16972_c0_g2_i1.p1  ORF type:complete len:574 (+),score=113.94 TRINITY_DN16972_c0_g2_i1:228-1949(+)